MASDLDGPSSAISYLERASVGQDAESGGRQSAILSALADAYTKAGETEKALAYYDKALKSSRVENVLHFDLTLDQSQILARKAQQLENHVDEWVPVDVSLRLQHFHQFFKR